MKTISDKKQYGISLLFVAVLLSVFTFQLVRWTGYTRASETGLPVQSGAETIQYDETGTTNEGPDEIDGYTYEDYNDSKPEELTEPYTTEPVPDEEETYYQEGEFSVYKERGEEVLSVPVDPLVDEPYPLVEHPAPLVEQPYPLVGQGPPLVEHPAPLVKQPSPLVRQARPLVNQPAPLVRQPSPLVSRPAPLVR